MPETPRLLFVHAHPDDESLSNGATIAHYTARGAQVRVVTCTLGEEGEVIGDRWAELAVDHADQLGGYRIGELTAALHALGVSAPIYPRRRRSLARFGHGAAPNRAPRQRFIDADEREAVGALVAIIREHAPARRGDLRPQRRIRPPRPRPGPQRHHGRGGSRPGGTDDYPGEPWTVPKFYWTVFADSAFTAGWDALQSRRSAARMGDPAGRRRVRRSATPTTRSTPSSRPTRTRCAAKTGGARRARHPGDRRTRPAGPARCRTTWRCRSSAKSTTSWPPAPREIATSAAGRRICSRDLVSPPP